MAAKFAANGVRFAVYHFLVLALSMFVSCTKGSESFAYPNVDNSN